MPQKYKIGCTERSPWRRAIELSRPSGVPTHFDVVCYWEGENFQEYEKELHKVYDEARVNENREFFHCEILEEMVNEIDRRWMEERYSFCLTDVGKWYLEEDDRRGPR